MKETNNVWDTQHLSQDISSELGKWFSTRLDAREVIRKHYKEINMKDNIEPDIFAMTYEEVEQ
jgi:hypothetical protein